MKQYIELAIVNTIGNGAALFTYSIEIEWGLRVAVLLVTLIYTVVKLFKIVKGKKNDQ